MELSLRRSAPKDGATLGEITINGEHQCFTLERDASEGKGSIPAGSYRIIVAGSNRFGRLMPRLVDVPGFEGILLHSGNTAADTEGCILVGRVEDDAWIGQSAAAFNDLFPIIEAACRTEEGCWIAIEDTP